MGRLLSSAALAGVAVATLSGCSPTLAMPGGPAADANAYACAEVVVHLPALIGDLPKRQTDAQGTGAWGQPARVLLYCGVDVPIASDLPCVPVRGIYWLREVLDTGYRFTTYGRDPAVSIVVDDEFLAPGIALDQLATSVAFLPANGRECLDLEDTVTGRDLGPADTTP